MILSRRSGLALVLASASFLFSSVAFGAPSKDEGVICIAPFKIEEGPGGIPRVGEPPMSTTPKPSSKAKFTFIVDKRLKASVKNGEMGMITGVPTDRKVRVEVRMNDRGFETFWLNLGEERGKRVCLWLYPGYWHWIDQGWDPKLGCKCEVGSRTGN